VLFSETQEEYEGHLSALTELQKEDYKAIFRATQGKSICLKLFDKPFTAHLPVDICHATDLAQSMFKGIAQMKSMMKLLKDKNPDFGLRGTSKSMIALGLV
jgi:phosphoenolpyruvate synthase/pyruvate phosphate dikinase